MRINHNIAALNASNRLKSNDNAISKNLQKLSSGYRINSAADDAAGLAVSEKMRSQINGLSQAEDNAQNGISLVQTAEGGLNETESILQRMNTLAVESANGTYQDDTDRANLNKEITALKSEVDRISTSTNFNGISLLDGSLSGNETVTLNVGSVVTTGAVSNSPAVAGSFTAALISAGDTAAGTDTYTITYTKADGTMTSLAVSFTVGATGIELSNGAVITGTGTSSAVEIADVATALTSVLSADADFSAAFSVSFSGSTATFTAKDAGTSGAKINALSDKDAGGTFLVTVNTAVTAANSFESVDFTTAIAYDGTNTASSIFTVNGQKFAFVASGADASELGSDVNVVIDAGAGSSPVSTDIASMSSLINSKTGLTTDISSSTTINFKSSKVGSAVAFQIGSDNKADQRVSLNIDNMSSTGLGIQSVSVATQDDAEAAIDTIKAAINTVSATRADLGALQNRLEHTTNNLSTMNENLTSAESTIRDVDMSSEMVDLTKNQILEQAATSMLAQANAQPQNVLSLLKG